jgi:hypothetical protein
MSKKKKKAKRPKGSGNSGDMVDSDPEFNRQYLEMAEKQFEKDSPGLHALMKRVQKEQSGDK